MIKMQFSKAVLNAFVLTVLLITAPSSGNAAGDLECRWANRPIEVDGQVTDWDSIPTAYIEDEGFIVGLCNDSTNLYILFRFRDMKWLRSIRMSGLTLWLDANGKKKKEFGFRYRGGPSFAEMQELLGSEDREFVDHMPPERMERTGHRMSGEVDEITVIYRGREQPETIRANGSGGPAVCFASSGMLFTYEFSVPLQTSDYGTYGMGAQQGKEICVGIEWGGMNRDDRPEGPPMGGGEGFGGVRDGGRMGGGRPGRRMEPAEQHEFWAKATLSARRTIEPEE